MTDRERKIIEAANNHIESLQFLFAEEEQKPNPEQEFNKQYSSYSSMFPRYRIKETVLNVHHKYYLAGNLPWHYKKVGLTTLCRDCHLSVHLVSKIPVYTDATLSVIIGCRNNCARCSGVGYLEEYNHVLNGICFSCGGTGGQVD